MLGILEVNLTDNIAMTLESTLESTQSSYLVL